jgi:CheY-like chemotaxis protein
MRICLIDDECIVRSTLREFLEELGHQVTIAETGDEYVALHAATNPDPDVIITDLRMPGTNGTNLLRELHRLCPEVPILVMSGNPSDLSPGDAISTGVHAYLRKPVRFAELEVVLVRLNEARERKAANGSAA